VPNLLDPTGSFARQADAVTADFRARSREVRPDRPRDGTVDVPTGAKPGRRPRLKRVVAFMGTNELSRAATQPSSQRAPNRAPVHP
jgi:hypothetical protein